MKTICYILLLSLFAGFAACNKFEQNFSPAYKEAVATPISFSLEPASPSAGSVGSKVRIAIKGMDSLLRVDRSKIQFLLNDVLLPIDTIRLSDSSVIVSIPDAASSGNISLSIGGKVFFGPEFRVLGSVWIDSVFNRQNLLDEAGRDILGVGANSTISDIYGESPNNNPLSPESYLLTGYFTSFNGQEQYSAIGGNPLTSYLIKVDFSKKGTQIFRTDFMKGKGPNRGLAGIMPLSEFPGYMIYGNGFSIYDNHFGVNNMTRIYRSGRLDTVVRNVYNSAPEFVEFNVDTVPVFTGGFNVGPVRTFIDSRNRIISVGAFNRYVQNNYDLSSYHNIFRQTIAINNVAAMDQTGNLDMTYNYNADPLKAPGVNGYISDAVQLKNGQIIIVGSFTLYNNVTANRILMLNDNGQPDGAFNASANGTITRITYNKNTGRILVCGDFTTFNGTSTPYGLVMLKEDGSIETNFAVREFKRLQSANYVNYAGQLDNGNIIVSGAFSSYDAVSRKGFMILSPNGALAPGMNNTGAFSGQINDMWECYASNGKKGVILVGNFSLFDNVGVGNIVKIGLSPK